MTGRHTRSPAFVVAALVGLAGPAAVPQASAQEAILLERIVAVRMATPAELGRGAIAQGRSVAHQVPRPLPLAPHPTAAN
ncbi:exported protein of unknown function [Beijerinckiaceae bacterium RH AL1]|nr:hypothetical protein [Beijerinckiaceae bacterium]VVB47695.1 exported protein of unknown function [Beijerinckiaceae bacterium RH CH11]VVB47776.1 exported protein of unknown function [Beijerinckiaceae bacterium RH AL8]VVC56018.1 exported protein of unknown function [Beijerinckiaceae bacterium RH AL1]